MATRSLFCMEERHVFCHVKVRDFEIDKGHDAHLESLQRLGEEQLYNGWIRTKRDNCPCPLCYDWTKTIYGKNEMYRGSKHSQVYGKNAPKYLNHTKIGQMPKSSSKELNKLFFFMMPSIVVLGTQHWISRWNLQNLSFKVMLKR